MDPEYQGYHIGDNLMKQIINLFENLLYVKIIPSDPKTIPFYERYGFKQYDNYSALVLKQFSWSGNACSGTANIKRILIIAVVRIG